MIPLSDGLMEEIIKEHAREHVAVSVLERLEIWAGSLRR